MPIGYAKISWIGGSALLLHKFRACNNRRDKRGADRATLTLRPAEPAAIGGVQCRLAIEGRRSSCVSDDRTPGTRKFPVVVKVVEPVLYTVEGRQGGDLRRKCGSALIRKAKRPRDRLEGRAFLAGTADKAH
jgi:hypothetical protein